MIPRSISHKISGLRFWERLLQVVWGVARVLAISLAVFMFSCFIDWWVDRNQSTPLLLRAFLFVLLVCITAGVGFLFIVWPLLRRLSDSELSLWVEDKHPQLQNRLITAVQLNQPGADLAGMSPELVAEVTREAEQQTGRIAFTKVADSRRLGWSLAALLPVLAVAALVVVLIPELAAALTARQFLMSVEIPRSVYLENISQDVWPLPSEQKVEVRFRVTGKKLDKDSAKKLAGDLYVQPDKSPRDRYPLRYAEWKDGAAEFVGYVDGGTDFSFWARLEDGRTDTSSRIRFVPRPAISAQTTWLVLPDYCGLRSDGQPYQKLQPRDDVAGIRGSSVRVEVDIQKPVKAARIELLKSKTGGDSAKDAFDEVVFKTIPMQIGKNGKKAEGVFPLLPEAVSYQIVTTDEYGFLNQPPRKRAMRLVPEDAPQVFLLREQFPPAGKLLDEDPGDFVVDGVPALLGGPIQVGYSCEGPYGIGEVRILYRVLKKAESGNDPIQQDTWQVLKMKRVTPGKDVGAFDFNRGVFEKTGLFDQVEYYDHHLIPEVDPAEKGGGRYDLKTKGLVSSSGELLKLKEADQVEYCVEVFAGASGDGRPSARSETRVTNVVGFDEFTRWIRDTIQEEQRLRSLEKGQRDVFSNKN